jgi:hypothetical protein
MSMTTLRSPYRELLLSFVAVAGMSVLAAIAETAHWIPWMQPINLLSAHRLRGIVSFAIDGAVVGIFSIPPVLLLRWTDLRKTVPLVYCGAALITVLGLFVGLDGIGFPFGSMELFFAPCAAVTVLPIILAIATTVGLFRRKIYPSNLCRACGYPVGTSPVCTECGKPVIPKSVEPR